MFSLFWLNCFVPESLRRTVILVAKDCSRVSFSFLEAHSSSLTFEVLAVEALVEEII